MLKLATFATTTSYQIKVDNSNSGNVQRFPEINFTAPLCAVLFYGVTMNDFLFWSAIINLTAFYLIYHFKRYSDMRLREDVFLFRVKIWLIQRGAKNVF